MRIQRFIDVSQTDQVPEFLLVAVGYQDLHLLSTLIRWLGANSAKSVENCISVEKLNTLNTDLQSILQNINKFAASQTRPILTNTRSKRLLEFCKMF